jgi:phosphate transport system ATP-binding protein
MQGLAPPFGPGTPAVVIEAPRRADDLAADEERAATHVSVRDLSFFYGRKQVLHGINIGFAENKVSALIGPSGCGKSTLLRTLNRMHEQVKGARVSGEILLKGTDLLAADVNLVRRRVGMVFQHANPFAKSIFDNVAYGVQLRGPDRRRRLAEIVESSLRRAALWDEVKDSLRAPAYGLSGGQQQRLCIARALAANPEVLLLDEPCSALDPIATAKIEALLADLKSECTIVIVTHNLQQAARVSEYTAFLLDGQLVEFATTRDLFVTPRSERTEAYVTGRFG